LNSTVIDIIGWIGAVALLAAYALISAEKVKAQTWLYQGLNLVGAAGLIVNSTYYGAYPSTFVNVIWTGIAIAALVVAGRKSSMIDE